ncbi:MAG: hypothetical protein IJK22_06120 [Bacteroidales bacterium]|nr:hypothetical protein [Bacteroidales bacterium]
MDNRITQPLIDSVMLGTLGNEVYVDGRSFALLLEIQKALSVLEPIGDDEARKIWLEIPRGTAEEWKAFDDMRSRRPGDGNDNLARYKEELEECFPSETKWLFIITSTSREYTFLKISDRDHKYVLFSNRTFYEKNHPVDMVWLFEPLLDLVKERVNLVTRDPDAYNKHIEEKLPYRQRSGRIRSKYLNKIVPKEKLQVPDREHCIEVMKELLRREKVYSEVKGSSAVDWESNGVPAPLDTMSIRTFCKYYRIADTVFWSMSGNKRVEKAFRIKDDVVYYSHHGLHDSLEGCDLDSEEAFKSFARDYYGEIGLARMNLSASDYYVRDKWIVTFGFSYSVCAEVGLRIAMALYETRVPFIFYEAENLLHALEESGTVRLSPFTFHDYLQGGDDEGVFGLPYVEDCGKEGALTRAQYDEIVKLAEWEPDVQLKLDKPIPLNDAVYNLIRDEVDAPMTLSEIRRRIEKKYDTYLSVNKQDGYNGYYYIIPLRNDKLLATQCGTFFPTFNEAMKALIRSLKEKRELPPAG